MSGRFIDKHLPNMLFKVAHVLSHRLRDELKSRGMLESEWRVLANLEDLESMSLKELEKHVFVPQSTLSRIIDRLIKKEHIERLPSQEDRRIVYVKLSQAGIDLVHDIADTMQNYESRSETAQQSEAKAHLRKSAAEFLKLQTTYVAGRRKKSRN